MGLQILWNSEVLGKNQEENGKPKPRIFPNPFTV
jgi:hypothetical protein